MEQYFSILSRCPLFDQVASEDLPAMLQCLQARTAAYPKNQTILLEGDPIRHVGIVLEGTVQILREDYYGNRNILSVIRPTQLFAEVFACAGIETMPVSVIAASDCRILLLDCHKVLTTCQNSCVFHNRLIRNLLHIMAAKNLLLNQKLEVTSHRTTREKLMAYLSQEAKRAGSDQFTIAFDRQQLADYLGVDRSAMSTELGKLKQEGRIDFKKNQFALL